MRGDLVTLLVALGIFIAGNLALGITFSTVSANQMQAMQFAQMSLLPSFLLSGFMFPFRGMPQWAQWLGELYPTTHAMRIVRGVLLKGNSFSQNHAGPLANGRIRRGRGPARGLVLSRDAGLRGHEGRPASCPSALTDYRTPVKNSVKVGVGRLSGATSVRFHQPPPSA